MATVQLTLTASHHGDPDKAVENVLSTLRRKYEDYEIVGKIKVAERTDRGGRHWRAALTATKEVS